MTMIGKGLIAALGLLVAGSITPASASPLGSAKPAIAVDDVDGLHLVGDRGSWVEPKTRWKSSKKHKKYRRGHDYGRYDGHHHHKRHFKRKKGRKFFKRGFKRGYGRGYDDGYYEGRRRSYSDRRRHHHHRHYKPNYGFQGGFAFGDGYFRGGNFNFRY